MLVGSGERLPLLASFTASIRMCPCASAESEIKLHKRRVASHQAGVKYLSR